MSESEFIGPSGKKYVLRTIGSDEYDELQKRATINSAKLIDEVLEQKFPNGQIKKRKREDGMSYGEQIAVQSLVVMEVQKLLLHKCLVSVDGVEINELSFHQYVDGRDRLKLQAFAEKINKMDEEEAKKSEEPSLEEKTNGSETKES